MIPNLNRSLSFKITKENVNKAMRKMTHQGVTGSSGKSKGKHLEAKQNMEVREQRQDSAGRHDMLNELS